MRRIASLAALIGAMTLGVVQTSHGQFYYGPYPRRPAARAAVRGTERAAGAAVRGTARAAGAAARAAARPAYGPRPYYGRGYYGARPIGPRPYVGRAVGPVWY